MKLIAQMIVRNEANRYLKQCLDSLSEYVDKIIIVDDASTDKTVEICKKYDKVLLKSLPYPLFNINESGLREHLWEMVRQEKPDWVLSIDADEIFDEKFKKKLPGILNSEYSWFAFKLCDMWDKKHYRIDGCWSPVFKRLFRFRNVPFGIGGSIHCGCVPFYVSRDPNGRCLGNIRIKHLGWIKDSDKEKKYEFYINRAVGVSHSPALSIKKPAILKKWKQTPKFPTVLICSLVRNREWCLDKFLEGLYSLDYPKELLSFYFLLNDCKDNSLEIIKKWETKYGKEYGNVEIDVKYFNTPHTEHNWPPEVIRNMIEMRNICMDKLGDNDYIFNIDSDIQITSRELLKHLIYLDKDVVSEVFWTNWGKLHQKSLPNVWLKGHYEITPEFLDILTYKGVYKVGGLGAITLISKRVIQKGVNYSPVISLPSNIYMEDRNFCVRCSCLGIDLWADTFYPVRHMEKEEYEINREIEGIMKSKILLQENGSDDLEKAKVKNKLARFQMKKNNINEALRYAIEATELAPEYEYAHNTLGELLFLIADYEGAIESLQKVNSNSSISTYNSMGMSYFALNKFDKAIDYFKKSLDLEQNRPDLWSNLGYCYIRKQNKNEALDSFAKALKLNPNYTPALRGIISLQENIEKQSKQEKTHNLPTLERKWS
jgi:glycosyltransferase involved in cell wall biosynthesis